jgi:molybdopterin synthase sulfur carrier subunit
LIEHLLLLHPHFEAIFQDDRKILIAVNQTVVDKSQVLDPGDEIAFFPPMTGG